MPWGAAFGVALPVLFNDTTVRTNVNLTDAFDPPGLVVIPRKDFTWRGGSGVRHRFVIGALFSRLTVKFAGLILLTHSEHPLPER